MLIDTASFLFEFAWFLFAYPFIYNFLFLLLFCVRCVSWKQLNFVFFFSVDLNSLHGKIQSIYIYCNDLCILFYPFYFTSYLLHIFTSSFIIFAALIALFIVFSFLFADLAVLLFPFLLLKCLLYYYLKTTCNFRIYSSVLWLLLIF